MPTVPKVNFSGAGIGATGPGGAVGAALNMALHAGAAGGMGSADRPDVATPEADAAMAQVLGLPGAPQQLPERLQSPDEESPRIQAHRDLVTATQHLPAAQRAEIQMQVLADPAAWGAKAPGER
jgi:hypothetical protein